MKGPHNADGINEVMLNNIKQVTWFLPPSLLKNLLFFCLKNRISSGGIEIKGDDSIDRMEEERVYFY